MLTNFKWTVMLVTLALTLAGLYGLYAWRQQHLIQEPLLETLAEIEGVVNVEMGEETCPEEGKVHGISVNLAKVENLPETYNQLDNSLSSVLGKGNYRLYLSSNWKTKEMKHAYQEIHYHLYEGERTGSYSRMHEALISMLTKDDRVLSYDLWVDQQHIYFQLESREEVMHLVIPIIRTESTC